MRPLVAGNWKMNGLAASLAELAQLKALLAAETLSCEVLRGR
jgi:triosephosphate isomerase